MQDNLDKYGSKKTYEVKNAEEIIKRLIDSNDSISISILISLASERVLPEMFFEDFFTMYSTDDRGFNKIINRLKTMGLINIRMGYASLNGTSNLCLTPLGNEVGEFLKTEEKTHNYPNTIKIFAKIIAKRLTKKIGPKYEKEEEIARIERYLLSLKSDEILNSV